VLVTDCTGLLGSAVARELLSRGAVVAGFAPDRSAAAPLTPERDAGRFLPLHGRAGDAGRLRTAVAVHEAEAVFLTDADRWADAADRAAAAAGRPVAVVTVRPAGELRLATESGPAGPRGVARFEEVFGPGDRRPVGGPARDYVFAPDAARAVLAVGEAALSGGSHDHTFRSGWVLTDREWAAALAGDPPAEPAPCPADHPLGWRPETPFAAAVAEAAAWYRQHLTAARPARRAA
jgi:nucleoside-diphosphate-sugar epimerase